MDQKAKRDQRAQVLKPSLEEFCDNVFEVLKAVETTSHLGPG